LLGIELTTQVLRYLIATLRWKARILTIIFINLSMFLQTFSINILPFTVSFPDLIMVNIHFGLENTSVNNNISRVKQQPHKRSEFWKRRAGNKVAYDNTIPDNNEFITFFFLWSDQKLLYEVYNTIKTIIY
jgi:hypothetical protein